jgi:hypothetical protein
MGKTFDEYQRLGIYSSSGRGYIVLVYDVAGQGERREYFNPVLGRALIDPAGPIGSFTLEHGYAGAQAILTGGNYASYLVWDGIRGLDYLSERKDVRQGASRLPRELREAVSRRSLLSAIDERIKVSIPVCYGGCNPDNPTRPGLTMADIACADCAPPAADDRSHPARSSPGVTGQAMTRHHELEHVYKVSRLRGTRRAFIVVDGAPTAMFRTCTRPPTHGSSAGFTAKTVKERRS